MGRVMAVNHHLKIALDLVSDAVAIIDCGPLASQGPPILYANRALAAACGMDPAALVGQPLAAITADPAPLLAALRIGHPEPTPVKGTLPGRIPCSWLCAPVRDASGRILNYILTAKPLPASPAPQPGALRHFDGPPPSPDKWSQDMVDIVIESSRFVAHEFNNALTAILLPVEMVIDKLPEGGDLQEKLKITHDSARRAAELAKDFLHYFKNHTSTRERTQLAPLLGRSLRLATCAQSIHWNLESADSLWDAQVNAGDIERVVLNLVRNAIQAMPGGGRLLVKAFNHSQESSGNGGLLPGPYVVISVRDWGPGIPENHLPHLFHSRFTTKPDGNGCGLPICHQIIRDHGGEIFVQSVPNIGTAFHIFIPAITSTAPHAPAPAPIPASLAPDPLLPALPAPLPPPAAGHPAILVIDDEEGIRFSLRETCRRLHCPVELAATGEAGIQLCRDRLRSGHPFDITILDINLRGSLNGIEVFHEIRRLHPDATIVATSGQYSESEIKAYESLGFSGFLPKPFSIEEFKVVLSRLAVPA
jgi:CheY-like chemotaxis protein